MKITFEEMTLVNFIQSTTGFRVLTESYRHQDVFQAGILVTDLASLTFAKSLDFYPIAEAILDGHVVQFLVKR